jgi:hypothetical protein
MPYTMMLHLANLFMPLIRQCARPECDNGVEPVEDFKYCSDCRFITNQALRLKRTRTSASSLHAESSSVPRNKQPMSSVLPKDLPRSYEYIPGMVRELYIALASST